MGKKKSTTEINKRTRARINELEKQIDCDHDWDKYGYGYLCGNCDYYTGMDEEFNRIIKKEHKKG